MNKQASWFRLSLTVCVINFSFLVFSSSSVPSCGCNNNNNNESLFDQKIKTHILCYNIN